MPALQDGAIAFANAVRSDGAWRFESIEVVPTRVERGSYRVELAGGASFERTMSAVDQMGAQVVAVVEGPGPRTLSMSQMRLIE